MTTQKNDWKQGKLKGLPNYIFYENRKTNNRVVVSEINNKWNVVYGIMDTDGEEIDFNTEIEAMNFIDTYMRGAK